MVRSSGGRSFQKRGAVMPMARLENMRREVTGVREKVKQEDFPDITQISHLQAFRKISPVLLY